jgi:hypothetical protein
VEKLNEKLQEELDEYKSEAKGTKWKTRPLKKSVSRKRYRSSRKLRSLCLFSLIIKTS